ncbi:hypothetical protein AMJ44_10435, partial [candidate division WOR-1 bacterium DG_54_3]
DILMNQLEKWDWIQTLTKHDEVLSMTMEKGERRIPELIRAAQENGVAVTCVHLRKPSLEDVFLHFTGRTIREQESSHIDRNREMIRQRTWRRR